MEHRKRLETSLPNIFKFYKQLTLLVLLSVNSGTFVSSLGDSKGLKKVLLQSTNNENFSFSLMSPDDQVDTNQTWKATEFQLYNISSILSDYPLVAHSIPLKNSSHNRYFFSKGKSASLTVTLKSFKQGILFLNFSYYIGKTASVANKSEVVAHQSTNETTTTTGSINLKADTSATSNSTHFIQNSNITEKILSSTPSTELNQSSMSASISSPLETLKIPEPISIKMSVHRKRRSLVSEDASSTHAQVKHMKNRHDSKNSTAKSTKVVTVKPTTNVDGNSSIAATNASSADVIDSLTLKQAVEMIRSAAAVISKSSVPNSEVSTPKPGKVFVTQPTGHTVVSSNSKISHKNSITGPKNPLKATKAVSEILPPRPSALPKLKHKTRSHHKSKNGNNNNSKNEKKRRKTKNKKVDNVERSENGKSEVNDDKHKSSSSSSSSSSSEEKIEGHEGKKPKISYKMWRASLEKKNRPSGLYVTVNEDIVFDNWDGIWDKHYVLGKWTGLKRELPNGKWNQTNLFLNWDDVTTPRDIKITFEWEPLSEDFELVLTDIDVSTLAYPDPCHCAPLEQSKDAVNIEKTLTADDKFNLSLNAWGASDNQSSMIVLKQNKDGKGNWEIIKVNSGDDESASDKIKDLDLFELPDNTQPKKNEKETHPEDILKAILEKWHDKDKNMSTTKSPLPSPPKETIIILTAEHEHTTPISIRKDTTSHVDLIAGQTSSPTTHPNESVRKPSTVMPPLSSSSTVPSTSTTTSTSQPSVKPSVTYPSTNEPTTVSTSATTTRTTTIQTTTAPQSIPSHTTNSTMPNKMAMQNEILDSPKPVVEPQIVHVQSIKKSTSKMAPQRKTDNDTALIVCIATGCLTLAILLMIIKKRIDISIRGKNATR